MNKDKAIPTTSSDAELLARALEALPSADQFMMAVDMQLKDKSKTFVVPYLIELHNVVHELLPKPNKGLWEPKLGLDQELLSYFALYYQNNESHDNNSGESEENDQEEKGEHKTAAATKHEKPFLRSKL